MSDYRIIPILFLGFLTSLSFVRTGCSLSELLTTYCSNWSSFPPLWLFPIKAEFPTPDQQKNRTTATVTTNVWNLCHLPDYTSLLSHLIPFSTTTSPTQKSILTSVAIMFWALDFVEIKTEQLLNPLNFSVSVLFIDCHPCLFCLTFETEVHLIDFSHYIGKVSTFLYSKFIFGQICLKAFITKHI